MSYYIPTYSSDCLRILIDKYDFHNYDYGTDELNNYAKTLPIDWFMSIFNRNHKGFSDFASLHIGKTHICNLAHYVFKDNTRGFQLTIGEKKYKYLKIDEEGYANYLFNEVLTPQRLIKRYTILLTKLINDKKEREKKEYPHHPEQWTPQERISKYKEYLHYYNSEKDTIGYTDDYRKSKAWDNFLLVFNKLKKSMTAEEISQATNE